MLGGNNNRITESLIYAINYRGDLNASPHLIHRRAFLSLQHYYTYFIERE